MRSVQILRLEKCDKNIYISDYSLGSNPRLGII